MLRNILTFIKISKLTSFKQLKFFINEHKNKYLKVKFLKIVYLVDLCIIRKKEI